MDFFTISASLSRILQYSVWLTIALVLTLIITRVYREFEYRRRVKQFLDDRYGVWTTAKEPPQVPYTVPWLGNAITFLANQPGGQWGKLISKKHMAAGVSSILIAGKKTYIIYNPFSIQTLFRDTKMGRDEMDERLFRDVFLLPPTQVERSVNIKGPQHEVNNAYLLKQNRVNELTTKFIEVLSRETGKDAIAISERGPVGLNAWLRRRIFAASTTALFGEKMAEVYPDYYDDFSILERAFTGFFFNIPDIFIPEAMRLRKKVFHYLSLWNSKALEANGGQIVDPEGPSWEPAFGARYNRARQMMYRKAKLDAWTMAAFDFGTTFALNTNTIPVIGWMISEALSPRNGPHLHQSIMTELRTTERRDGTIDIPTLMTLPRVQSLWTEVLRFYIDILVVRNLVQDVTLPLDDEGRRMMLLKKGSDIMTPTWLQRNNPVNWTSEDAPVDQFWAERFLADNPDRPGEKMFVSPGTTGKLFPFGGGRTMCPGRVFAKQEVLGAFALVMLKFDFKFEGYLDENGRDTNEFPSFANCYPGSGGVVPKGDIKVRLQLRPGR